jgi:hypothetical protein
MVCNFVYLFQHFLLHGLEIQEYDRRDLSHWPHGTLYPQKLALTLSTSGFRSDDIVSSQTRFVEFSLVFFFFLHRRLFNCGQVQNHSYPAWHHVLLLNLNYLLLIFCYCFVWTCRIEISDISSSKCHAHYLFCK